MEEDKIKALAKDIARVFNLSMRRILKLEEEKRKVVSEMERVFTKYNLWREAQGKVEGREGVLKGLAGHTLEVLKEEIVRLERRVRKIEEEERDIRLRFRFEVEKLIRRYLEE